MKIRPVGKLYLVWLAWTAIGCFLSPWPWLAIQGYHSRQEGLIAYITLTIFALLYWQCFEDFMPLFISLGILGISLPFLSTVMEPTTFNWLCSPPVAQSALFAIGTAILYSMHRSFVILTICGLVNANMRSGLIGAIAGILVYEALTFKGRKKALGWLLTLFVGLALVLPFTKLGYKLSKTDFSFAGSRSQWALAALESAYSMPLTGWGLDVGSEILKPATGPTADKGAVADKTHNIIYDLLIFTGWPGLALALFIFVYSAFLTWETKNPINITCMSGLAAFAACGFINPLGLPGICLALVCLFGLRKVA